MKARVGDVPVGTRIVTLLTGRRGTVCAHVAEVGDPVAISFEDGENKLVHPEVRVGVEEYTH